MKPFLRAAAAALALVSFAGAAAAQEKLEPPHVSVAGEAELNVMPDEVRYDVTLLAFHKELKTAKTQVDDRLKGLVALVRKHGVAESDTQTDYVKVETRYKSGDAAKATLGYAVRKDLVFTLRDITQAEALLSEVLDYGVTRVNSITFSTSKMRLYRDEARAQAMKAAQEKAAALAGAVGQRIGKAITIEEEVPGQSGALPNYSANTVSFVRGDSSDSEGTLEIGLIKVSARVSVKFALE
ncbi:MAG: SIMPL domain-containing protein [Acidobacteria bacterium]|nr:SIMPL domain-containing protein [Acidobacteriota bacterium]